MCEKGDILITVKGSGTGKTIIADKAYCISRQLMAIRPKTWDPYFLWSSVILHEAKYENASMGLIPGISRDDVLETPIWVPDITEQFEIGKRLSIWDSSIILTERLIATKQERRKWLMQQLLTGKWRLAGFGKPSFNGATPEGWQILKTEKIFQNTSKKNCQGETVLSVTQDEGIVPRDSLDRKINMSHENTHTYKLVEPGNFVISLRSFQGGLEYSRHRGLVSPAYHVISPRVKICDDFYRLYFKSNVFIQRLAVATIGIRDGKQISFGDFAFMKIPVPPLEEQIRIASIIDTADRELALLRSQIDALREQKKGLMQQLLTGKRRIKLDGKSQ